MLTVIYASQFKRDLKRAKKRGKDISKLISLLEILVREQQVPDKYMDHQLQGNWQGYRDAHIESDWLLIYRVTEGELRLARTGSHSDIFE